jgi:hypothetical protein
MNKNHFSALTLRTLLLVCVIVLTSAITGGFFFTSSWLSTNASDVKTKSYTTVSGKLSSNDISKLQEDVTAHNSVSIKATGLIMLKQNSEQIIRQDLNKYASSTGISITNLSATQQPSYMTTDTPIAGIEPQYFSVSLAGPIPYAKLFEFIEGIESNTPKMKLTGISIDSASGQSGSVLVKPIIIEVYTK